VILVLSLSPPRRALLRAGSTAFAAAAWMPPFMQDAQRAAAASRLPAGSTGPTNEVVRTVEGIRHKRLGGSNLVVSEMGLGTQRWGSADFNGPDEALCHKLMDRAILEGGINLIDTAEQYPIPSTREKPEGNTERIIGSWLAKDKSRRSKVVIASKITGGRNVNAKNIIADCEGSLSRLGTDYLDVYTLHWPARYVRLPESLCPRFPRWYSWVLSGPRVSLCRRRHSPTGANRSSTARRLSATRRAVRRSRRLRRRWAS
jgi:hypothetical protein